MRILFIQPPIQDFYDTDIRLQPLGLCYLKAAIKKEHPDATVLIKDYHNGYPKKTIPLPKEMHYLKDFYIGRDRGPFSTFDQYYHFGASFLDIIKEAEDYSPDLIGISSLFSPYYEEVLTLSKMLKEKLNTPIIVGGHHATVCYEMMLESGHIDYVIRGEGEKATCEFISYLKREKKINEIPNLCYQNNKKIICNPIESNYPINEIPFPDFSDLKQENYSLHDTPLTFILSSRGCPYRCDFCSIHELYLHKFHPRSVDNILDEMKLRYEQGYRIFDFEDDNLTYNKKRSLELFNKIKENFKDIKLVAMNGISYLHLDEEILFHMKQAGFKELNLALVSMNDNLNTANQRPHNLDKFKEVVTLGHKMGFKITAYQIIGHPEDSLESMIETLSFLASLPVLIGSSIFYLIKGTGIEKRYPITSPEEIKLGRLTSIYQKNYPFTQSDIFTLFVTTRIINFLKSDLIDKDEYSLSDILNFKSSDTRINIGIYQLNHIVNEEAHFIYSKQEKLCHTIFNANLCKIILSSSLQIKTCSGSTLVID